MKVLILVATLAILFVSYVDVATAVTCYQCDYNDGTGKSDCISEALPDKTTENDYCYVILGYLNNNIVYAMRDATDSPTDLVSNYLNETTNGDQPLEFMSDSVDAAAATSITAEDRVVYIVRFCDEDLCNGSPHLKVASVVLLISFLFNKLF